MKLLIVDTCGTNASIVFAETAPGLRVLRAKDMPGRTASERLVAAIRELAGTIEGGLRSLGAVVVVSGPGSFTGVRVGVSAAKGLCEALGVPLIAISRLAVLARLGEATEGAGGAVWVLLDAGRGEAYLGVYVDGVRVREPLVSRVELMAAIDEARAQRGGSSDAMRLIVCEPVLAQGLAEFHPVLIAEPCAADVLALAAGRIEGGEFDDIADVDANYLRRTDAEIFAKLPGAAKMTQADGAGQASSAIRA